MLNAVNKNCALTYWKIIPFSIWSIIHICICLWVCVSKVHIWNTNFAQTKTFNLDSLMAVFEKVCSDRIVNIWNVIFAKVTPFTSDSKINVPGKLQTFNKKKLPRPRAVKPPTFGFIANDLISDAMFIKDWMYGNSCLLSEQWIAFDTLRNSIQRLYYLRCAHMYITLHDKEPLMHLDTVLLLSLFYSFWNQHH